MLLGYELSADSAYVVLYASTECRYGARFLVPACNFAKLYDGTELTKSSKKIRLFLFFLISSKLVHNFNLSFI